MDIAALGLSVDSKPVEQATQALNKFAASGKPAETAAKNIGAATGTMTTQMAAAIAGSNKFNQQVTLTGKNAALSSYALTNLSFQINDVATQAALGQDPMRILAAQAGQFYQILSTGEGGVRGSLGYLKDLLVGMVSPLRLVVGGVAAIGITGALALNSVTENARAAEIALSGIGRASGVSAADVRALSIAAAEAGTNSVGGAQAYAVALASTGRVTSEIIAQTIEMSRVLDKTFGEDAAEKLASALSNPIKGVDDLNKRLLAFDDSTVQNIKSLARQGDLLGAQREIMRGVKNNIVDASVATSGWERAWDKTTGAMSLYFEKFGNALDRSMGGGTSDQKFVDAQKRLFENRNQPSWLNGSQREADLATVAAAQEKALNKVQEELRLKANDIGSMARAISPQVEGLRSLMDEFTKLSNARYDPQVTSRLDAATNEALEKSVDMLGRKVTYYKTGVELAREELGFAIEYANARSASERADIAYRETQARLLRDGKDDSGQIAEYTRQRILGEAQAEQVKFLRDRALYDEQNLGRSQVELAIVGQTAVASAGMRAEFEAMAEAKRRANELGGVVSEEDVKRAQRLRTEAEATTAAYIAAQVNNDLMFERSQMGRSEREQNVYSRLQSAGLLSNGEIAGGQAQMIANQIRFNEVMKISQDSTKDFTSTFVKGMMDGQSATEALADALNRLAGKFADMAIDGAASSVFKSFSEGVAGGATGGGLFAGIFHDGGEVGAGQNPSRYMDASVFAGAKRYHNGGVIGADEMPAILQKGETVIPRGGKAGGSINVTVNQAAIYAQGADPAAVARLQQGQALRDAALKQQIIGTIRQASQDGLI